MMTFLLFKCIKSLSSFRLFLVVRVPERVRLSVGESRLKNSNKVQNFYKIFNKYMIPESPVIKSVITEIVLDTF